MVWYIPFIAPPSFCTACTYTRQNQENCTLGIRQYIFYWKQTHAWRSGCYSTKLNGPQANDHSQVVSAKWYFSQFIRGEWYFSLFRLTKMHPKISCISSTTTTSKFKLVLVESHQNRRVNMFLYFYFSRKFNTHVRWMFLLLFQNLYPEPERNWGPRGWKYVRRYLLVKTNYMDYFYADFKWISASGR